jgi:hypothetical protein
MKLMQFTLAALLATTSAAHAATVLSNNPSPGDAYTNSSAANQGQAIGASGWYYNNVRNGATVGVNTERPRDGNGSVSFKSEDGGDKADLEFLANGVDFGGNFFAAGSLGAFSDFSGASYEWWRDGASTNPASQHPVLRILLDADGDLNTTGDRGGLVFERVYAGGSILTDQWVGDSIGADTALWNFGLGLGFAANINATAFAYDATLTEWQAFLANAAILGFSSGVGSGWNGEFGGAVDNISWTIAGQTTTSNFETTAPIPLPAPVLMLGSALLGLGAMRLRRKTA